MPQNNVFFPDQRGKCSNCPLISPPFDQGEGNYFPPQGKISQMDKINYTSGMYSAIGSLSMRYLLADCIIFPSASSIS